MKNKIRLVLFLCMWPALFVLCDSFTDPFDYDTTTSQINSTNYTQVIYNSDTSSVVYVPFGGLSIANTNAATTSTVYVIWADSAGHKVSIFQGTIVGPTNILHVPSEFNLQGTNQSIQIKMDAAMTNGLLIKYFYIMSQAFQP